jgi:hypothetical protein
LNRYGKVHEELAGIVALTVVHLDGEFIWTDIPFGRRIGEGCPINAGDAVFCAPNYSVAKKIDVVALGLGRYARSQGRSRVTTIEPSYLQSLQKFPDVLNPGLLHSARQAAIATSMKVAVVTK